MSLSLLIALLVGAMGMASAQDDIKAIVTGIQMVGGDVETLDPSLSETSSTIEIVSQMYIGLVIQDETTGNPIPGLAESWTVDEEGVYTFTLRQGIPWARYNADTGAVEEVTDADGNVRYVTANDIVYGWQRALAPETAAPYSYVPIPYIEGAAEYNAGEADASALAVTAVDDYTLQIDSPGATAFTPSIYGLWIGYPLPQWTIEENGDAWIEPEYHNAYGPFVLKEWAHDESLTIIKNPFWPGIEGRPQPALDEVTFRFLESTAQFAEYQAGTMDAVEVPVEEIERVKADSVLSAEYYNGVNPCTYYIGFDNTEAPIDNVNLRRALSYAIDRQSIVDNVTRGGQIAAQWFARPGLAAAPTLETHPDLGVQYDAEAAQAFLATALEELGLADVSELPALSLSYGDSSNHGLIMQAIQQMWTETLGITVTLTPLDPTTYFSVVSEDAPMMYRSGWCQDYGDANNFLYDVFYSQSSQNDPGFNSPEFDALVEQARVETDLDVRRELYAQADQILSADVAGIAPIYWYTENQLTKPYIERTYSVVGTENYSNWDIVSQ
jgi:oligopeptide transport system substrate-binding protein